MPPCPSRECRGQPRPQNNGSISVSINSPNRRAVQPSPTSSHVIPERDKMDNTLDRSLDEILAERKQVRPGRYSWNLNPRTNASSHRTAEALAVTETIVARAATGRNIPVMVSERCEHQLWWRNSMLLTRWLNRLNPLLFPHSQTLSPGRLGCRRSLSHDLCSMLRIPTEGEARFPLDMKLTSRVLGGTVLQR